MGRVKKTSYKNKKSKKKEKKIKMGRDLNRYWRREVP
jgi:hypothetical protein